MLKFIKDGLSLFNFSKNSKMKIKNPLTYNFKLSPDQINVSHEIINMFKDAKTPRLIQLISQPQAGKTNTIINICSLIDHYSMNTGRKEKAVIFYFQPSDNALKKQLKDRFKGVEYWDRNLKYSPEIAYELIDGDFEVCTPTNIKGLNDELEEKIASKRKHKRNMIFIHDESHRDIDADGKNNSISKFPAFYEKNHIFLIPGNRQKYDENNFNKMQEMYINISASPSSFIEYMKKDELGSYTSFYLKNHDKYLSFKDIHEAGRFKSGFLLNGKKQNEIEKFIITILCEHFLLQKPGCFITRLSKGVDIKNKIQEKIDQYINNPQLLQTHLTQFLDSDICNFQNITKIMTNIQKLRLVLFSSTSPDSIKDKLKNTKCTEYNLVNNWDYDHLKIEDMEYFLTDHNQNGDFKLLFIMESFLQGKTLELNNVRGWFERYHENAFENNAFTIQSVGRNCGPYKDKNYTYPIWVNLEEIRHIINFYDEVELSADENGLIDRNMWHDENVRGRMFITNTYVRQASKKKLCIEISNKFSQNFESYEYEADVFLTKNDAVNYLKEKLSSINLNLEDLCIQTLNAQKDINDMKKNKITTDRLSSYDLNDFSNFSTAVSKHEAKDAISDILLKNYGRYCKTAAATGFRFGLIHIDEASPNPTSIQQWNEWVVNNKSESILTGKQGQYVAYITRIDQTPLTDLNRGEDKKSAIAKAQKQGN